MKNPDERQLPELDSKLKAIIDDMKRRYRVEREWAGRAPDGKDAA